MQPLTWTAKRYGIFVCVLVEGLQSEMWQARGSGPAHQKLTCGENWGLYGLYVEGKACIRMKKPFNIHSHEKPNKCAVSPSYAPINFSPHYPPCVLCRGLVGIWFTSISTAPPQGAWLKSNPHFPPIPPLNNLGIWLHAHAYMRYTFPDIEFVYWGSQIPHPIPHLGVTCWIKTPLCPHCAPQGG